MHTTSITIQTVIQAPRQRVWTTYNEPEAIKSWNQASPDWHCPSSENDLQVGGRFSNTMAAKDGSFSFDFSGTYTEVIPYSSIQYSMDDGRTVHILFVEDNGSTTVNITFDAEATNPIEMQRAGWQAILDSFKAFVEK